MSSPISSVPSNCSNWPRTVAMPRCFTEKPTVEWAGSTVHVPAGIRVAAAVAVEFMLLLFVADAVASGSLKLLADATIAPRRPSAHGRNRRVHVLILRKSQSAGAAAGKWRDDGRSERVDKLQVMERTDHLSSSSDRARR